jgi:thioredoxin 2
MDESVLVVCEKCSRTNRVPTARLAQGPRCGNCKAALLSGAAAALDESNFSRFVEYNELPVVVNFMAPGRAIAPAFEAAAREMRTRARFANVNAEQARGLLVRCRVRSVPTVVLFREGREVGRISRPMDSAALLRWVQSWETPSASAKSA